MLLLILTYPTLTHLAVALHMPVLQWLALTVLSAIGLYEALRQRRLWAWTALVTVSAVLYVLVRVGGGLYALYLPPILLPAALFGVFVLTLRAGHVPIITRFAAAVRENMPDELVRYTRSVTVLWSWTFAALTLSAFLTALLAPPNVWSLTTNVLHYLVLGTMFLGEYLYRVRRFRHLEHPGFVAYIRMLFRVRIRSL